MSEIRFQLTERDFVRALNHHVLASLLRARTYRGWGIVAVVYFLLGFGMTLLVDREGLVPALFAGLGFGLLLTPIVFGACIGIGFLLRPRAARRQLRQNKEAQRETTMTLADDGLHFASETSSVLLPFGDIHQWGVWRDMILVYRSDMMFHIIPDRSMSGEQRDGVVRALSGHPIRRIGPAQE